MVFGIEGSGEKECCSNLCIQGKREGFEHKGNPRIIHYVPYSDNRGQHFNLITCITMPVTGNETPDITNEHAVSVCSIGIMKHMHSIYVCFVLSAKIERWTGRKLNMFHREIMPSA